MKKSVHKTLQLYSQVAKFRIAAGWTRAALAQRICVSRNNLYQIEQNFVTPSVFTALQLAKYLNVPVEALFMLKKPKILTAQEKLAFDIQQLLRTT